jgi:hypothetical protein
MRRVLDLFLEVKRGLIAAVIGAGFACAGLIVSAPALAVIPPPPPGAPAVESAPSSLVGLGPQLPPSVTHSSAQPVIPGAVTRYQIQIFPTLATIAPGDRLTITLSSTDTPHLTPLPVQLPKLAGGIYTIDRSAAAPSSLTVETLR